MLHEPGRFALTFVLMPSCYLGCDVTVPVTLNVLRQTAAEREGKTTRRGGHGKALAVDPEDEDDDVRPCRAAGRFLAIARIVRARIRCLAGCWVAA